MKEVWQFTAVFHYLLELDISVSHLLGAFTCWDSSRMR